MCLFSDNERCGTQLLAKIKCFYEKSKIPWKETWPKFPSEADAVIYEQVRDLILLSIEIDLLNIVSSSTY